MAAPKLRVVYHEAEGCVSYFHMERSEALRAIEILRLLPEFTTWTPVSKIAKRLGQRLAAVLWTLHKLAGASRIDVMGPDGRQVVARRPVLLMRKDTYNNRNNMLRTKYLKPTVYIRKAAAKPVSSAERDETDQDNQEQPGGGKGL